MQTATHSLIASDLSTLVQAMPIEPRRVSSQRLFSSAGAIGVGIAMDVGTELKEHKAGVPILVHVLEGNVAMEVAGERFELSAGALVHVDAHVHHALEAHTQSRFLLLLLDGVPRS